MVNEIIDMDFDFYSTVYDLTAQIPRGRVSTYGAIARAMGDIIASQAVGRALNLNPRPFVIPCHRVVASDGSIGGFGLGVERKIELLRDENIHIEKGKIINFEDVLFEDFDVRPILKEMRALQTKIAEQVLAHGHSHVPYALAIDVHYPKDMVATDPVTGKVWEVGFGGCVLYNLKSLTPVRQYVCKATVRVPYIPTYLGFREMPVIKSAVESIDIEDYILMIDGNGILHPRFTGIASHAGVIFDKKSVGVAKSLLCGRYDERVLKQRGYAEVIYKGELRGFAVIAHSRIKRPVFISPGHHLGVMEAFELVKPMLKHRIPEPLRIAHKMAKTRAKKYIIGQI